MDRFPPTTRAARCPCTCAFPSFPGFRNPNKITYNVVNLDILEAFDGTTIDPEALRSKGLVRKKGLVKILGSGDITKAVTIKAHAFSQSAVGKIEAAGGTTEVLSANGK